MNEGIRVGVVLQVLIALISGLLGVFVGGFFTYFVYYQPRLDSIHSQLGIMNASLQTQITQLEIMQQKEAHLVMTVVPAYQTYVKPLPNGTIEEKRFTLILSKTQNTSFSIYVSNVGNAFAHILYYSVAFYCDVPEGKYREIGIPFSQTLVLKPNESTRFEYFFDPITRSEILGTVQHGNLTFCVGSAEARIYEIVPVQFS